ncbi:DUF397 domain-containing protein [Streptomyces sp. NBC_00193]|uniref:DUF397 domain-containing protein n=1 Tax=Streptomyces sp. NBC_00193 TaxID=2975675 RepID=UPI00225A51C3|nr:DUF397 domain-containing protein [Streptomyces sp. NBC_00193]MCX5298251.1 DUF397 domain-containing protein [Streptomyces sp. NBC_00193]
MGTTQDLTGAQWRKSTYSGGTGGDCVECAPLGATAWRKASYSGTTGGECVEIAPQPSRVAVRDSKRPDGPAFTIAPEAFGAFVRSL